MIKPARWGGLFCGMRVTMCNMMLHFWTLCVTLETSATKGLQPKV